MNGYNKPVVYNIPNPEGLDEAILHCQNKLAARISWLEAVYGRAYKQYSEDTADKDRTKIAQRKQQIIFPETWGKNKQAVNVMPNENIKAQCFFYPRDPGSKENGDNQVLNNLYSVKQPISIIFWANLELINPAKKYRYSEELKAQIAATLMLMPAFEFSAFYEDYDKILEGFTITGNYTKYTKPPFWGLRCDGYITYSLTKCGCFGDAICFNNDVTNELAPLELRFDN